MFTLRNENEVLQLADKIRYDEADRQSKEMLSKEVPMGGAYVERCYDQQSLGQTQTDTNEDVVRYHDPTPEQAQRITTIRAAARNFLDAIDSNCGPCADASAAKRHVRDAMMTANAAIVLSGRI